MSESEHADRFNQGSQSKGQQVAGGMEQIKSSDHQLSNSALTLAEPDPPPPPDPPDLDLTVTNDRLVQTREAPITPAGAHVLNLLPNVPSFSEITLLPVHAQVNRILNSERVASLIDFQEVHSQPKLLSESHSDSEFNSCLNNAHNLNARNVVSAVPSLFEKSNPVLGNQLMSDL